MRRVPGLAANVLVVMLSISLVPGICRPQLTWFLDSATLYAPGDVVQPDLAYCQPGDGYPCPGGSPNQQVVVEYNNRYTLEDQGGEEFASDVRWWNGPSNPYGWDATPTENEIIVDGAIAAMEGAAAQQIARGTADDIGAKIAARATSGSGTVYSGLAATASYGVRFIAARLAVA